MGAETARTGAPAPGPDGPDDRDGLEDPGGPGAGRTARGGLWLALNGVVVKTSQTVVLLTLAALLQPEALGLVALGTVVANVAVALAGLGTASALVYWRGPVERAARTAVTLAAVTGTAVAAVVWVLAPWLTSALGAGDDGPAVVRGLVLTAPLVAVSLVTADLLRRRLSFLRRVVPDSVGAVVGAVVAITLAAGGTGVMSLVAGQVVQAVVTLALSWVVHAPVRPGWSGGDARGLLSYGAPLAGGNLLQLVQLNVDYVVVSVVLGAAALGQYSLAFRIAFMPYLLVAVVVGGAAFPYLCRLTGRRLADATVAFASVTVVLVTPLCLGVALFADHLVVLGDQWAEAVPVAALLAGYAWLLAVLLVATTTLDAAGRTTAAMVVRLAHLVLLLGALALVTRSGVSAVAAGQLVAAAVAAALGAVVLRSALPDLSAGAVVTGLRPAAVGALTMTAALLAVRAVLEARAVDPSVATLLLGAVVGLAAYAVPVLAVDASRVRALRAVLAGPR